MHETAFHVEDARPANDVAIDSEWPVVDGADRPNCVVMTNNELRINAFTALCRSRIHMLWSLDRTGLDNVIAELDQRRHEYMAGAFMYGRFGRG